jgi:hypothetical protein
LRPLCRGVGFAARLLRGYRLRRPVLSVCAVICDA